MKQVVILFGPPGAGKGTQAELLSSKLDLFNFETSKILEEAFADTSFERYIDVKGEKFDMLSEKQIWLDGKLCSPPFVTYLVKNKIKKLFDAGESIVFSGSPRTVYEAEELMPFLIELYGKENIKVFYIDISTEQTIHRNSNRRICELMRHSILFDNQTKDLTICPLDGSKLIRRELDVPEVIKVRIEEFKNRTYPIKEVYANLGVVVNEIKGEQTVSRVFQDISKHF